MYRLNFFSDRHIWVKFVDSLTIKYGEQWRQILNYSLRKYNASVSMHPYDEWITFETEEDMTAFILEWQ